MLTHMALSTHILSYTTFPLSHWKQEGYLKTKRLILVSCFNPTALVFKRKGSICFCMLWINEFAFSVGLGRMLLPLGVSCPAAGLGKPSPGVRRRLQTYWNVGRLSSCHLSALFFVHSPSVFIHLLCSE